MQVARSLLEEFRLSNPENVPPDLFDWLHDVFGRMLNGEAPDRALGMKRGRGQRKKSGQVDPIAIAMYVKLKTAEGVKLKIAKDDACDHFHRDMDTIRAAVRDVKVEPGLSEETLRDYIRRHSRPE